MSSTARIGIIGTGAIGRLHAACITRDLEGVELAGCCGIDPEATAGFAREFACAPYATISGMIDGARPDAVCVCTPSGTHMDCVLEAVNRGVHVLCEKPLEVRTDRIDRMIEAAERNGVLLGGIFMLRYMPALAEVRKALLAGRIGPLAAVQARVPWWREDSYYGPDRWQGTLAMDGGGALMNQSIHMVDLILWLAAAALPECRGGAMPVAEVFASAGKLARDPDLIEVEDTAAVTFTFANGALGQLLAATSLFPGGSRKLLIGGRDGTIELEEHRIARFAFRAPEDRDAEVRERFGGSGDAGGAADPMSIDRSLHARNIEDFIRSVQETKPAPIDGREARKAVAVIEAAYRSARSGRPEKVA